MGELVALPKLEQVDEAGGWAEWSAALTSRPSTISIVFEGPVDGVWQPLGVAGPRFERTANNGETWVEVRLRRRLSGVTQTRRERLKHVDGAWTVITDHGRLGRVPTVEQAMCVLLSLRGESMNGMGS